MSIDGEVQKPYFCLVEKDVNKSKKDVTQKKKQQILVPHDFSDAGQCAVSYGLQLAAVFKCELTIIHILSPEGKLNPENYHQSEENARSRMAQISGRLQQDTGIKVNAYVFKAYLKDIVHDIIERINAIVLVAGLNTVSRQAGQYFTARSVVRDFRELRIPILVVQNKMPEPGTFDHIILPIDFTRESKEKASWAGYFSKLHQSVITVVHTEYRDGFFAVQLANNLILVKKLFNTLEAVFDIHKTHKLRYNIDHYCVSYAKMKGAGLLIITATKDWGFGEFLLGPAEQKIITNEDQLPVMLINPRDDLFVPCV